MRLSRSCFVISMAAIDCACTPAPGTRGDLSVQKDAPPARRVPAMMKIKTPEVVTLTFFANVDAKVVDASDGGEYGKTGEPISFVRSDRSVDLKLEAMGYHPLAVTVEPRHTKSFHLQLRPVLKRRRAPKSAGIRSSLKQVQKDMREIRAKVESRAQPRPRS